LPVASIHKALLKVIISQSPSIEQIITGCLQGQRKAQKALFERYSPIFMGICLRYITEKQCAEDVMIMAFRKIFDRIGQFRNDGSFEGWMKRIVVNEALMHIRSTKSVHLVSESDSAAQQLAAPPSDIQLDTEILMTLIGELPQGYRTVFNLYAIDGFTHQEIAKQLGITESTSKSQLHKARKILIDKLESLRLQEYKNMTHEYR
jgi:RNA polymerase sigma-70 factor (ECF subfamily)